LAHMAKASTMAHTTGKEIFPWHACTAEL